MRYFGTGKTAKMLQVTSRTVAKWFDGGLLKGWRLPTSGDRRITEESIRQFVRDHEMPMPEELETEPCVPV